MYEWYVEEEGRLHGARSQLHTQRLVNSHVLFGGEDSKRKVLDRKVAVGGHGDEGHIGPTVELARCTLYGAHQLCTCIIHTCSTVIVAL